MKKDYPKFTLRVSKEMLYKLTFISKFYERTKNKEIELILKKYIADFEKEYGLIPIPDDIDEEDF